jgi:hypothetical protein
METLRDLTLASEGEIMGSSFLILGPRKRIHA